ncbi:MAG TPA: D-glycero-beta-D-manno-heptose-7-phosphate kinase [Dictyoglomaceae bacterium]|nr:D-glycero-beta-D-manno-heptose-7-phosphate kinase [Dictyoglomaceae bacterium]HOL39035.1 D-glycero-beta-D-manno-heptose-7-phosphate kinase [Dictyoglomaceae bacterium]HOP94374.1 D-glycero-beta-D-manno-heptose-7-phosphate kinase [Dictyoglomaceae bacterium]HPP15789.1 D-glycero-beta-D-manno-heptose-7-phosphate kinase [Dictyoglomaceae bacterium]HPU42778.1 D-glycero-beta-D-manno-heptose-7-phosphate kinase [Dictyoglomaceae bacterium]
MDIRERLIDIINSWQRKRLAILGDVMLDEYIIGNVERISPEAPVPIVEMKEERYTLGGAANVANNIKTLGGEPFLFGVIGEDREGEKILEILKEKDIHSTLIKDKKRPTTLKTRILALGQQIVRIDKEQRDFISSEIEEFLFKQIRENVDDTDLFILSDYAKGVLTPSLTQNIINLAKKSGKEIIVDPKGQDYSKYRGASFITPNEKEAKTATNINENFEIYSCGEKLLKIIEGKGVLITRGEKGMFLYQPDLRIFIPALRTQVRDITGAGDTVVSAFSLALISGANPLEAALIANFAAGCVVRKLGSSTLTVSELISILPEKIELRDENVYF